MAQVTHQEEEQIRAAFAEAESEVQTEGMPEVSLGGTKDAFCSSWPTVKEVLDFLKEFAPPGIRQAIAIVIKAGDKIFGNICPVP